MISPASAGDVRDHRAAVGVARRAGPARRCVRTRSLTAAASAARPRSGLAAATTRLPRARQRVDDAVPAGRLGERAVDEDDRRLHEGLLWAAAVVCPAVDSAEPVLEAGRGDACVVAGGEGVLIELRAEVARVGVGGYTRAGRCSRAGRGGRARRGGTAPGRPARRCRSPVRSPRHRPAPRRRRRPTPAGRTQVPGGPSRRRCSNRRCGR